MWSDFYILSFLVYLWIFCYECTWLSYKVCPARLLSSKIIYNFHMWYNSYLLTIAIFFFWILFIYIFFLHFGNILVLEILICENWLPTSLNPRLREREILQAVKPQECFVMAEKRKRKVLIYHISFTANLSAEKRRTHSVYFCLRMFSCVKKLARTNLHNLSQRHSLN